MLVEGQPGDSQDQLADSPVRVYCVAGVGWGGGLVKQDPARVAKITLDPSSLFRSQKPPGTLNMGSSFLRHAHTQLVLVVNQTSGLVWNKDQGSSFMKRFCKSRGQLSPIQRNLPGQSGSYISPCIRHGRRQGQASQLTPPPAGCVESAPTPTPAVGTPPHTYK